MNAGLYIIAICLGYLLGAIPFGLIIARIFSKQDVRKIGSGKTGTTNVMRAAGKKAAALVLILDLAKGALAVVLARIIVGDSSAYLVQALAGVAAVAGHTWSLFLGFKGGRGVATFIGGLLAMFWPGGVLGGICIVGLGIKSRYMSLGSITGAVIAFIYMLILHILRVSFLAPWPPIEFVVYAMLGAVFIYVMHRDNIHRLMNGTERKIGEKPAVKTDPSSGVTGQAGSAHNAKS